jgi:hypothetical protein
MRHTASSGRSPTAANRSCPGLNGPPANSTTRDNRAYRVWVGIYAVSTMACCRVSPGSEWVAGFSPPAGIRRGLRRQTPVADGCTIPPAGRLAKPPWRHPPAPKPHFTLFQADGRLKPPHPTLPMRIPELGCASACAHMVMNTCAPALSGSCAARFPYGTSHQRVLP